MRLRIYLFLVLLAIALFAIALDAAGYWDEGDEDGYFLAVTYEEGDHIIGDAIDVTVNVFNGGAYTSVDDVELRVGYSYYYPKMVSLSEYSTGRWMGSFIIEEDDVESNVVALSATAYVGEVEVESSYGYIQVLDTDGAGRFIARREVDPPGLQMSPGDEKEIIWSFYFEGGLVDPDEVLVEIDSDIGYGTIEPPRVSLGRYSLGLDMTDMTTSYDPWVHLTAYYTTYDERELRASDSFQVFFNFFHIWAKRVSHGTDDVTFDLHVSDMEGDAVDDALIDLECYYYDDYYDEVSLDSVSSTTDANGVSRVRLAFDDLPSHEETIELEGTVQANGLTQAIDLTVTVREPEGVGWDSEPSDDGFDVTTDRAPFFKFSTDSTFQGIAYFDGVELDGQELFYYLHTQFEVVSFGSVTTGGDGTFQLDFRSPREGTDDLLPLMIHIEVDVGGLSSSEFHSYEDGAVVSVLDLSGDLDPDTLYEALEAFQDEEIDIAVGELTKAEEVLVTVEMEGASESWECLVTIGCDPNPMGVTTIAQWTYMSGTAMEGQYGDEFEYVGDGVFQGSLFIPENLPNGPYFVVAVLINRDVEPEGMTGLFDYLKLNYITGITIGDEKREFLTDFDPLIDGFSFRNRGTTSHCTYLSAEEVKTALMNDPSSSSYPVNVVYWMVYLFAKESHEGGHCYGMCSLAMNYYAGNIEPPGMKTTYELPYEDVADDIEYYQNQVLIDIDTFAKAILLGTSALDDAHQYETIKAILESGQPVVIGLYSPSVKHAVIGYDLTDEGDILIYDPSVPSEPDDVERIIAITSGSSGLTVSYQWGSGTTFTHLCALSYEEASFLEQFYDHVSEALWVRADCPVTLTLKDGLGRTVGDSFSDGETHLVVLSEPSGGYTLQVVGTGVGLYDLTITRTGASGFDVEEASGSIETAELVEYSIEVSSSGIELERAEGSQDDGDIGGLSLTNLLLIIVIVLVIAAVTALAIIGARSRSKAQQTNNIQPTTQHPSQYVPPPQARPLSPSTPGPPPQPEHSVQGHPSTTTPHTPMMASSETLNAHGQAIAVGETGRDIGSHDTPSEESATRDRSDGQDTSSGSAPDDRSSEQDSVPDVPISEGEEDRTSSSKFCGGCGKRFMDDDKFCQECGRPRK